MDAGYPDLEIWPVLMHHYPGLTLRDLATAPRNIIRKFIERLPFVLAQDQMAAIQANAIPQMEERDRREALQELTNHLDAGLAGDGVKRARDRNEFMHHVASEMPFGFEVASPEEVS